MPKVSVLLPVYNTAEAYLRECIEGILGQTFSDFELIIVNDASTDANVERVVKSYDDPRIRYYLNEKNLGISETRNKLIDLARGEYLAVHDHDDVSVPERFEKQAKYLDTHPEIGVLGTAHIEIPKNKVVTHPLTNDEIEERLMYDCPLIHPSVMMRKSVLIETGVRYDKAFFPTEDYNLYLHLIGKTRFANLPEVLFKYRKHDTNTINKETKQIREIERRVFAYLESEHPDLWRKAQANHVRVTKISLFGIPVLKIKHFQTTTNYYLFGFIPVASVYSKITAKGRL
ncbi:MAG: glycosyltransferase [Alphaproteobacteria bacterium]|nr:glycosyltransferase [Alphaproteobacteria bacterium]